VTIQDIAQDTFLPAPQQVQVKKGTTVKDIKNLIRDSQRYPVERQRLFFNDTELADLVAIDDLQTADKDAIDLALSLSLQTRTEQSSCIEPVKTQKASNDMKACIEQAADGLKTGLQPSLSEEGTSGSYFLKS